jgi:hypothetical protein
MYGFILNMWVMKRLTVEQVTTYVTKGFITQEESNMILVTPQV